MPGFTCSEHPEAAAKFACDGCARRLCERCVKEGHRLYFCAHCGERALALEPDASSAVNVRRRDEKVRRAYSFSEALGYAFRGSGRLMLPAYVAVQVFEAVPGIGGAVGFLALMLVPGLMFAIVRTTAEGEIELPEWPDYSDPFERFLEIIWYLLVQLTALAPMALFFYLSDCDLLAFLTGAPESFCWLPLLAGLVVGTVIGVFAFGAVGTHNSGWLSFRVDLHLRALLSKAAPDGLKVAAMLTALFFASELVGSLFAAIPLAGAAVAAALSGYAIFTGAHLVGLIFRRHQRELDLIYRD